MFSFVWYQGRSNNSDGFFFILFAHYASNRLIEIEWAVKHGTDFIPTPKKPRRAKKTKAGKGKGVVTKVMNGDEDEENMPMDGIHQMLESESSGSANPLKRFKSEEDVAQALLETPQKKVKCEVIVEEVM